MSGLIFEDDPGTGNGGDGDSGGLDDGGALDLANAAAAEGLWDLAAEYLEQFNELLEASGDGE